MILVKDRTGSKNGTADSTLVGVFDSKRPLYRIVKWLILHIFPPVFRLLYGPGVILFLTAVTALAMSVTGTTLSNVLVTGMFALAPRLLVMRVSGLYDAVFIVGI